MNHKEESRYIQKILEKEFKVNNLKNLTDKNNIWVKKSTSHEEYYSLERDWKIDYFVGGDSDEETIKKVLEYKIENKLDADTSVYKYAGTNIYYSSSEIEGSQVELPPGTYYYSGPDFRTNTDRLVKQVYRTDEYLNIFDKAHEIQIQLNKFLNSEKVYRDLNCIYKFAMLLYGPQGMGKTAYLRHLINTDDRFKNAIVVSINETFPSPSFLRRFVDSTKGRLKVFILEEITNLVGTSEELRNMLTFLDGEHSVDNSIIFATTNHPELLPKNIIERPSRIDKLYKMDSPNKEEARKLVTHYYRQEPTDSELNEVVGQSSDFIKEICLNALRNEIPLKESLDQVKKIFQVVKDDFNDKKLGL